MTNHDMQDLARHLLGKSVGALDPEECNVLANIRIGSPIGRDVSDRLGVVIEQHGATLAMSKGPRVQPIDPVP